jgi:chaperonin cofactor prefoldin
MRCPFCDEEVRDDAPVCRHCGNDLKIPESLRIENTELKKRVESLERELTELRQELAVRKKSR